MKTKLLISAFLCLVGFITTQGQNVNIPDPNFKAYLIGNSAINTNGDNQISVAEAQAFTGTIFCIYKNISDLTGIEAFVNIIGLYCSNNQLSSLDVSNNTALYYLDCSGNQLTSLDVSNNTALTDLYCFDNQLSGLDLSNNTALTELYCRSNQLSSLDLSNNTALERLFCNNNQLSSLDLSNNTALTYLYCNNNPLGSLDVSNNTALEFFLCNNNQLNSLDISNNTALKSLNCSGNPLGSLDVSNNTALILLTCNNNQLTSLDVSNNTALTHLTCNNNPLGSLDLSNNTALEILNCSGNQLNSLDISNNTALIELYCAINPLGSLDLSNNTALEVLGCYNNQLSSLDLSNNTALIELYCNNLNNNFQSSLSNQLSSLDLSNNTALELLNCSNNQLSSLDLSNNTALELLNCSNNQLSSLDVSNNTALEVLRCENNQLSSLDLSNNTALTHLTCNNNQLTSLNLKNGNNTNIPLYLSYISLNNNPFLRCIQVDNAAYSNWNWANRKDVTACFSENCVSPTFDLPTMVCQNATQTLPTTSDNNFVGTWWPHTINTSVVGTQTYIFRPTNCYYSYYIDITVTAAPDTPTGEANQTFNAGQTIADLVVNGDNLVWYSNQGLTTTIPNTTALVHNTTYYVVEQDGNCKSAVLAITVTDCATLVSQPTGDANQTFNAGQTLADLNVNGSNLIWYSDNTYSNTLSLSEPLVDGATYYVVSEVGNCRSEALVITVEEQASRSDFDWFGFKYYPNPTSDILTFISNTPIEKVTISTMLGQEVNVNLSSDKTSVDLSNLPNGNYLVKVTIEGASKTIKVVKQ